MGWVAKKVGQVCPKGIFGQIDANTLYSLVYRSSSVPVTSPIIFTIFSELLVKWKGLKCKLFGLVSFVTKAEKIN